MQRWEEHNKHNDPEPRQNQSIIKDTEMILKTELVDKGRKRANINVL